MLTYADYSKGLRDEDFLVTSADLQHGGEV
jgi:hypothetical protein